MRFGLLIAVLAGCGASARVVDGDFIVAKAGSEVEARKAAEGEAREKICRSVRYQRVDLTLLPSGHRSQVSGKTHGGNDREFAYKVECVEPRQELD